ncbi:exodeoxyribonuclease VII large subunit [Gemella sp. GH3]|uniref:exodeoxyribonuclease VII large subunit n=1 Tax=unclassified Gemella TaxID=2624949 RepID=UPI0015D07C04|nr:MULTISPECIES: exodeoxyribonuclease VII large subunit [unclassified Gemella]MBF0713305.1 exodeoxyribonuclease VII large subunit [Gemella sp. GH3.1]NYS50257.1 exodeoxyribonuclease VII large subunit [Gemella sp. GH3]
MENNGKTTYLTITALNRYLEKKYQNDPYLKVVYVKGEVSNLKFHSTGTMYFSLKDENTIIKALKFNAQDYKDLKEGDKVLIKANLDFYFPYGEHRLKVEDLQIDNVGDLYRQFIELRDKLNSEGIFDSKHKKNINKINNNIAVITSSTGAAIQDIKRTLIRRYPLVNLTIYPSLVQGDSAVNDLIKNLKLADSANHDVIILARGGGSIEDLFSFNNEYLVREIFNCNTPIVTGVGHETDTTLVDYVADMRASTPTAAAEIVTSITLESIKNNIILLKNRLNKSINSNISYNKNILDNLSKNHYIKNFSLIYKDYLLDLDYKKNKLNTIIENKIEKEKLKLNTYKRSILNLDILDYYRNKFYIKLEIFNSNSPLTILQKGYTIITDDSNNRISSVENLKCGDNIKVSLQDGRISAKVIDVESERNYYD